ncbi:MAG: NADH-quinone oxidoreductase subunit L [Planctomycetes bacterium]|nr:NADH-quinone oxidoreductase subunit L [Planctomycetota bacterium]
MPFLPLIPLLPLAGALACGLLHLQVLRARRHHADARPAEGLIGTIATLAVAAAFALSLERFFALAGSSGERVLTWRATDVWIPTGGPAIPFGFRFDALSSVMCLVITGVGALIHLYSIGYMKGDRGFARFFTYLNLFVAAMLVLVLADSMPVLFIGWEGVGLCSYLLIGFWYEEMKNAEAGQKAFVVNRVGDFGFLLAMFAAAYWTGSFEFTGVNSAVEGGKLATWQTTVLGLLLFVGACGKSAQIPLYVWLPDAMAGPTPVSALIHAATMVTAGVYLVIRTHPIFDVSPIASGVVACTGAATAIFAGSMGLVARDIKKVLAYSTVSQLGFLFLGAGVGAYGASFYHLVTHAFFKALLFLGAGSVILALHHEQDLFKMGGLRRALPGSYRTMWIGAAALAGLPLFSGFFSKDEILAGVLGGRPVFGIPGLNWVLYAVAAATALMTSFYTFRLIYLAFEGEPRGHEHPHPNPTVITLPLVVLAVASVAAAVLGLPFGISHALQHWLEPVIGEPQGHLSHSAEILLLVGSGVIALLGFAIARATYGGGLAKAEARAAARPALYNALSARWWIDELYDATVVRAVRLTSFIAGLIDAFVIDGLVNGAASLAKRGAASARRMADGSTQTYALWFGAGMVVVVASLVLLR